MRIKASGCFTEPKTVVKASFVTVLYIEKGGGRFRVGDTVYQVERGEAFLILPGFSAECVQGAEAPEGRYVLLEAENIPVSECGVLYPDETGKKLFRLLTEGDEGIGLFRHLHACPPKREKPLSARIPQYVSERIDRKLSALMAAEELGVSRKQLETACKEVFGCGFLEYVRKQRHTRAKHLLQNKTLKISEVSKKLGYTSEQYFSVAFKKETGMTPKDWRKFFRK